MQKTWLELLGADDKNCVVELENIVVKGENGARQILHSFDDEIQARQCFQQWKKEIVEFYGK